jgi:hypothetical protein
MGTTSVLIAAVNGLNTLLAGTSAITTLCTVYDGPPIVDRSSDVELWVGALGVDQDDDSITFTRAPVTFGGGPAGAGRDETILIPCAIWAIGGETEPATRRAAIDAVFAQVCTALAVPDPLGNPAVFCGGVEVAEGSLRQLQTPDGAAVVLTFTIRVDARI